MAIHEVKEYNPTEQGLVPIPFLGNIVIIGKGNASVLQIAKLLVSRMVARGTNWSALLFWFTLKHEPTKGLQL